MGDLQGNIICIQKISGKLSSDFTKIRGDLSLLTSNIRGTISAMTSMTGSIIAFEDYPIYEGQNEIYPRAYNETVLETSGYKLNSNIIVKKVPYFETSNTLGETVYIAEE